ncbi:MAG: hypothetical protein ACLT5P_07485 [Flavonifractor plautii]
MDGDASTRTPIRRSWPGGAALWVWQPNDTIRVLEDEAVTIPLS